MFQEMYQKCIEKLNIWYLIFAMLFSGMLTVSKHVFNFETGISSIDTVYVTDFHFVDLIVWIGTVTIIYILIKTVAFFFSAGGKILFKAERTSENAFWVFIGSFILIMLLWLPYLPSYWPGGIYSDTVDSIDMALYKKPLDNHNPILYTLIWRGMFWVTGAFSGKGEYGGLKLFTVVQTVVLALALSHFIYRCYKWGIHKAFVLLCLFSFGLFPLYPFYGISMWKDTLFSLAVFLFSVFLYSVLSDTEDLSPKQILIYCAMTFFIIFLRNNGIYVAIFYSASITVILLCLKRKKAAVKIGITSAILLIISGVIQGPIFDRCGYNVSRSTESLGIPLQQAAYIISTDGIVTEEDMGIIECLMPIERWKELYNPIVADTIKFSPEFDHAYMEVNTGEFFKMYLHLVSHNPVKAVKAYMLCTLGFWDVFESSSTAYICNFHFGNVEYFMSDYFDYYTNVSFRNFVEPKYYISSAVFAWLMLGTVFICLAKRNYKGLICVMPTLGVWLSIMLAVPVAFSFRYIYALFLCVPLYLISCAEAFR